MLTPSRLWGRVHGVSVAEHAWEGEIMPGDDTKPETRRDQSCFYITIPLVGTDWGLMRSTLIPSDSVPGDLTTLY